MFASFSACANDPCFDKDICTLPVQALSKAPSAMTISNNAFVMFGEETPKASPKVSPEKPPAMTCISNKAPSALTISIDEFRFGDITLISPIHVKIPLDESNPTKKDTTSERTDEIKPAIPNVSSQDIFEYTKGRVVGNEASIKQVVRWFSSRLYSHADTPTALLLVGPPGCGKTMLIHLVAQRFGLQVMSMVNDIISLPEMIDTIINLSMTESFGQPKAYLCDNFDIVVERKKAPPATKGKFRHKITLTTLLTFLKNAPPSCSPIIFIASDLGKADVRTLSEKCIKIEMKELNYNEQRELATRTIRRLHLSLKDKDVKHVIEESNGDGRRLMNELQWMCQSTVPSKLKANVIEQCEPNVFKMTKLLWQASLSPEDCMTVLRQDDRLPFMMYDSCYNKVGSADKKIALQMARIWAYSDRGPTTVHADIAAQLIASNLPVLRRQATRHCYASYTQMFKWKDGVKKMRNTLVPLQQKFMGADTSDLISIIYLFQEMNTGSRGEKRKRGDMSFGKMFQECYGIPFNSFRSLHLLGD